MQTVDLERVARDNRLAGDYVAQALRLVAHVPENTRVTTLLHDAINAHLRNAFRLGSGPIGGPSMGVKTIKVGKCDACHTMLDLEGTWVDASYYGAAFHEKCWEGITGPELARILDLEVQVAKGEA